MCVNTFDWSADADSEDRISIQFLDWCSCPVLTIWQSFMLTSRRCWKGNENSALLNLICYKKLHILPKENSRCDCKMCSNDGSKKNVNWNRKAMLVFWQNNGEHVLLSPGILYIILLLVATMVNILVRSKKESLHKLLYIRLQPMFTTQ